MYFSNGRKAHQEPCQTLLAACCPALGNHFFEPLSERRLQGTAFSFLRRYNLPFHVRLVHDQAPEQCVGHCDNLK